MKKFKFSDAVRKRANKEVNNIKQALTGKRNAYTKMILEDIFELKKYYVAVLCNDLVTADKICQGMDTAVYECIPNSIFNAVEHEAWMREPVHQD